MYGIPASGLVALCLESQTSPQARSKAYHSMLTSFVLAALAGSVSYFCFYYGMNGLAAAGSNLEKLKYAALTFCGFSFATASFFNILFVTFHNPVDRKFQIKATLLAPLATVVLSGQCLFNSAAKIF